MYRHFIMHDDFDVFIASDNPTNFPGIESFHFIRSRLHRRLSRTRLRRLVHQFEICVEPYLLVPRMLRALRVFNADAIFTIPDNTLSWTAYLLSRITALPFITNFQDWWPRGQFHAPSEQPFPMVRVLLERRFRRMYRASALAFCTSEGMRRFLGHHNNSVVLFPCPDKRRETTRNIVIRTQHARPVQITYAGTLFGEYGKKLLSLARALCDSPNYNLRLYGHKPDWPANDIEWASRRGIYCGFVPLDQLKHHFEDSDVFLVVMSSSPRLQLMMETSFTTKFLEATQYGKPVIVWGPAYCQPVQVAKSTGAGLVVEEDDVSFVLSTLDSLCSHDRWLQFAAGAWQAATTIFDHDRIHRIFQDAIYSLVETQHRGGPATGKHDATRNTA